MIKLTQILNENTNVSLAINQIKSLCEVNFLNPRELIFKDYDVAIEIDEFEGKLYLNSIRSWSKTPGQGSAALKEILKIADNTQATVIVNPEPFGNKKLSKSKLISWYKRHGFKKNPDHIDELIYTPE